MNRVPVSEGNCRTPPEQLRAGADFPLFGSRVIHGNPCELFVVAPVGVIVYHRDAIDSGFMKVLGHIFS